MSDFKQVPQIDESQASKYETHNEAVRILRILAQAGVISRTLTAPPGGEADGDLYIPAAPATGTWAGHENHLAFYSGSAYVFLVPDQGWCAYVQAEDAFVYWNGAAWVITSGGSGAPTGANPVVFAVMFDSGATPGKPPAGAVYDIVAPFAFTIPATLSHTKHKCKDNPTAQVVLSLAKNGGAAFGTITIAIDGTVTLAAATDTAFVEGDVLSISGFPAPQDATWDGVYLGIYGMR